MPPADATQNPSPTGARFATTHWSLIRAAGGQDAEPVRAALSALCGAYWSPIYAFIRHQGYQADDAQDLTQAFFARPLEKNDLAQVDRERGRFRSFLLAAVMHFLANERDKARARKRGGGQPVLSLDFRTAEDGWQAEPGHGLTPEKLFARRYALALLDQVLVRLRSEWDGTERAATFARLKDFLTGSVDERYARAAADLGMSESAVKVAVHRLRRRYRALLREEIAKTVAGAAEVEEEIRELFEALG
jgi:RNA polymerase sigma-70 factor (ECF subfamily)